MSRLPKGTAVEWQFKKKKKMKVKAKSNKNYPRNELFLQGNSTNVKIHGNKECETKETTCLKTKMDRDYT